MVPGSFCGIFTSDEKPKLTRWALHITIYVVGDRFGVPDLKCLARKKFSEVMLNNP